MNGKDKFIVIVGSLCCFAAAATATYYFEKKNPPIDTSSPPKEMKGVVVESGKTVLIGSEPEISAGFTLDGKVGFLSGSRPVSDEVYKVVIKIPGDLLSIRGGDGTFAQRLSYDVRPGDTVRVTYVERFVKNQLTHKKWSEVKNIKKIGLPH